MADHPGDVTVAVDAYIREEHDWVARDGRAWAFRLLEVTAANPELRIRVNGVRVAFLANEDDFA